MQHPIDLLAYYRDHLYERAARERRDPPFCRTALQLCRDLRGNDPEDMKVLQVALRSVLKQASWHRPGALRVLGPIWLDYNLAHSQIGPSYHLDKIRHLAASIAKTAAHYPIELFGSHSCASDNQRRMKVAALFICMAIRRGMPQEFFASLPKLPGHVGPHA
jgi:hypothetical protein